MDQLREKDLVTSLDRYKYGLLLLKEWWSNTANTCVVILFQLFQQAMPISLPDAKTSNFHIGNLFRG